MRSRYSPDHRAAVLRRFSTSELSLAAFCRQEGLAYQSVLAWRRANGRSKHCAKVAQDFVAVECRDNAALSTQLSSAPHLVAELSLPGGACLRVFSSSDSSIDPSTR